MNITGKYVAVPILGLCLFTSGAVYAQEADPTVDVTATQMRAQTQVRDQSGAGNQMKQQQTREQKKDQTDTGNQMKQEQKRQQKQDQATNIDQRQQNSSQSRQAENKGGGQGRSGNGKRGGGRK